MTATTIAVLVPVLVVVALLVLAAVAYPVGVAARRTYAAVEARTLAEAEAIKDTQVRDYAVQLVQAADKTIVGGPAKYASVVEGLLARFPVLQGQAAQTKAIVESAVAGWQLQAGTYQPASTSASEAVKAIADNADLATKLAAAEAKVSQVLGIAQALQALVPVAPAPAPAPAAPTVPVSGTVTTAADGAVHLEGTLTPAS